MESRKPTLRGARRVLWPFQTTRDALHFLIGITAWLPAYVFGSPRTPTQAERRQPPAKATVDPSAPLLPSDDAASGGKLSRLESLKNRFIGRLLQDFLAGMTVGVTVIPQALAYAQVAGLPASAGLYCALIPALTYTFFGGSKHLIVGPTAVLSLMVGSLTSSSDGDGKSTATVTTGESAIERTALVSFVAGMIFLAMAGLRAGFVAQFLSRPVVSGFTSAAAIVIIAQQLGSLLGVEQEKRTSVVWELLAGAFEGLLKHGGIANVIASSLGIGSICMIMILRRSERTRLIPSALIAVVAGCFLAWSFDFEARGVLLVGKIDRGFPTVQVPRFVSLNHLISVLPTSLVVMLIGFMEAYSIGKTFAVRANYELNANQELWALGMSNVAGSFFSAYPATGSFSRTAVNFRVGALSALSNFIAALLVLVTVLWLTPLFYFLPETCLAAIIMTAVINLFDYDEVIFLWRTKPRDLLVWLITFGVTLSFSIELGILAGLLSSVSLVMWRMAKPHMKVDTAKNSTPTADNRGNLFGKHSGSVDSFDSSVSIADPTVSPRFDEIGEEDDIAVLTMLQSYLFMNASVLKDAVIETASGRWPGRELAADMVEHSNREASELYPSSSVPRAIVIDASTCNDIDSTAIHTLADAYESAKTRGVIVVVGGARKEVREQLLASRLFEPSSVFCSLAESMQAVQSPLHLRGRRKTLTGDIEHSSLLINSNVH